MVFRKYMAILNAIEVQIEDEYANPEVADMLFESLAKLSRSIGSAAGDAFGNKITDCQRRIAKRLAVRATAKT